VQNFGLASAASVVLGVVLFALTVAQLAATRRKDDV
jgi:alpha-1,4-digalacturonate transport system permease protein